MKVVRDRWSAEWASARQRIRFTDEERRRLAGRVFALGRKALNELQTSVMPDTLLRSQRELVARKWDYSQRRGSGRPRTMKTIVDLILRMALENAHGDIRAFEARSRIWDMRSHAAPSPTSSVSTASSLLLGNARRAAH